MTITYEQFAEYLLKHSVFEYGSHETVHAYITEDGRVRFFANWGYGETRDYASLKSLMEGTTGNDLPDAEDLAEEEEDAHQGNAAASFKITPTNHTRALCWLLSELHGGNQFSKEALWHWLEQANVRTNTVTVDAAHLRFILDYLHDSEADHYDPETYPEEVNTHVYPHVLAIEAQLKPTEKGGAE